MKFFRNMYQKSKEQKGFTLVEMIVVLVIIAILAAITIPALLKYIDKAKDKQLVVNARTAYLAAETAASEAYAANVTMPASIIFDKDGSASPTTTDAKIKAVEKNASELTGMTNTFKCTVTLDTGWKVKTVTYVEGSKQAALTVGSNSDWTVSTVATP